MPHALLLPPFTLFLLAAVGLLLARLGRRRAGRALVVVAAVLGFLLSMPLVGGTLRRAVEERHVLDPGAIPAAAGAIVVLGGDQAAASPEYGRPSLGPLSLGRVRYAALLARATGLPVLTTGGVLRDGAPAVGVEMARVLREELGTPVRWVDARARNTWENAQRAAELLLPEGIHTVVLVTDAWHLPRARWSFEHAGLAVVSAPTGLRDPLSWEPGELVPSAKGLTDSAYALHEVLGRIAYRLGLH